MGPFSIRIRTGGVRQYGHVSHVILQYGYSIQCSDDLLYPHTDLPIPSALFAPPMLPWRNSCHSPRCAVEVKNI